MKKRIGLLGLLFLPIWFAQADVSVSTGKMELNKDCIRLDGDNVQLQSKDCQSDNKGKGEKENRSVHGDNNPGKGHDKNNKKDKK